MKEKNTSRSSTFLAVIAICFVYALVTLSRVSFLLHQTGSFASAWVGGLTVSATGSYTLIRCIDAVLCVTAAVFAFCVKVPGFIGDGEHK